MSAPRIGLISCGKTKAAKPCAARGLYQGALFKASLRYAEATCERVYILSAFHVLLPLDQVVEPYERELSALKGERRRWGRAAGRRIVGLVPETEAVLVVLAGAAYADSIDMERDYHWEEPLKGLQIGQRLAWLNSNTPAAEAA